AAPLARVAAHLAAGALEPRRAPLLAVLDQPPAVGPVRQALLLSSCRRDRRARRRVVLPGPAAKRRRPRFGLPEGPGRAGKGHRPAGPAGRPAAEPRS